MIFPDNHIRNILFIDIETAAQHPSYDELSDSSKAHWKRKMRHLVRAEEYPTFDEEFSALFHDRAAIYAEFGKVICISMGYLTKVTYDNEDADKKEGADLIMKVKTLSYDDEGQLLSAFRDILGQYWYDRHNQFLCGHNIREFDVPFICRRMLVNNIQLPNLLNIAGMRPWQVPHLLDTMEMWKFGDYKHYTSLDLLCAVLEIESPKGEMDGSQVSQAYWEGRIKEIADYCQKDVVATARVYLKCKGLSVLDDDQIVIID